MADVPKLKGNGNPRAGSKAKARMGYAGNNTGSQGPVLWTTLQEAQGFWVAVN